MPARELGHDCWRTVEAGGHPRSLVEPLQTIRKRHESDNYRVIRASWHNTWMLAQRPEMSVVSKASCRGGELRQE